MPNQIVAADQASSLIEEWATDIRMALPPNIPFQRMRATFITAVANNPEILTCDVQSIRTALLKSATDNLLPDNREAAIVPYFTKVREGDREVSKKLAQYLPMVAGIRKRAKELGGIRTIISEVVYTNDFFDREAGDDPKIVHKPPQLGKPRGEVIGAYSIFKDDDDYVVHREVMDREEIEKARAVSRAKNGPGWMNFYGEMCRKTVVRRGAKSVPSIPEELRTIIDRDDELTDFQLASGKTIDGNANPLLEDGGRQQRQAMDRINPETGEVTSPSSSKVEPSAHNRSHSGSNPEMGTTSSARAPRESDEQGNAGAATGESAPRIRAGVLEEYSTALMRFASRDNLKKAAASFWKENGGFPANQEDDNLARFIFDQHGLRADGNLTADEVKTKVAEAISQSFEM